MRVLDRNHPHVVRTRGAGPALDHNAYSRFLLAQDELVPTWGYVYSVKTRIRYMFPLGHKNSSMYIDSVTSVILELDRHCELELAFTAERTAIDAAFSNLVIQLYNPSPYVIHMPTGMPRSLLAMSGVSCLPPSFAAGEHLTKALPFSIFPLLETALRKTIANQLWLANESIANLAGCFYPEYIWGESVMGKLEFGGSFLQDLYGLPVTDIFRAAAANLRYDDQPLHRIARPDIGRPNILPTLHSAVVARYFPDEDDVSKLALCPASTWGCSPHHITPELADIARLLSRLLLWYPLDKGSGKIGTPTDGMPRTSKFRTDKRWDKRHLVDWNNDQITPTSTGSVRSHLLNMSKLSRPWNYWSYFVLAHGWASRELARYVLEAFHMHPNINAGEALYLGFTHAGLCGDVEGSPNRSSPASLSCGGATPGVACPFPRGCKVLFVHEYSPHPTNHYQAFLHTLAGRIVYASSDARTEVFCCDSGAKDRISAEQRTTSLFAYAPTGVGTKAKRMATHYLDVTRAPISVHALLKIVRPKDRSCYKVLSKLYPPPSDVDDRHMSVHLKDVVYYYLNPGHVDDQIAAELASSYQCSGGLRFRDRLARVNSFLRAVPIGTNQVLATVLFLAYIGGPRFNNPLVDAILGPKLLYQTVARQTVVLKSLSQSVRRCAWLPGVGQLTDEGVARLTSLDMAFGRASNLTDWAVEKSNRCTKEVKLGLRGLGTSTAWSQPLAPISESAAMGGADHQPASSFFQRLQRELDTIVHTICGDKVPSETLQDFWARRAEWITSGSSSGATVEPPPGVHPHVARRVGHRWKVNKRGWAESIDYGHLLQRFNSQKPREEAHASEKMENGKARAIYGVDPYHYVINTYGTMGLEERLHLCPGLEKGASGALAYGLDLARARLSANTFKELSMFDFADFNRHHTPQYQAEVFWALVRWGESNGACRDWIKANAWVARSKENMWCVFPDGKRSRVVQGMFSGTKSTDLINTILNLAYFRVVHQLMATIWGVAPSGVYNVHQGDDVWYSGDSATTAAMFYYVAQNLGLVFQGRKQMFGPGRGEYLRVLYSRGTAYGYTNRALINFVLRPIQNDVVSAPRAWASTIRDGISTLFRRGLNPTALLALWSATMPYWTTVKAHAKDERPVSTPWWVWYTPSSLGGWGTPFPLVVPRLPVAIPKAPEPVSTVPPWLSEMPNQMARDWVSHVSKKLPQGYRDIDANTLREHIAADSYKALIHKAQGDQTRAQHKRSTINWLGGHQDSRLARRVRAGIAGLDGGLRLTTQFSHIPEAWGGSAFRAGYTFGDANMEAVIEGCVGTEVSAPSPYNGTVGHLAKFLASSEFKSLSLAGLALGQGAKAALTTLMHLSVSDNPRVKPDLTSITQLLTQGSDALIDLALSGGSDAVSSLDAFCHKGLLGMLGALIADRIIDTHSSIAGLTASEVLSLIRREVIRGVYSTMRMPSFSRHAMLF